MSRATAQRALLATILLGVAGSFLFDDGMLRLGFALWLFAASLTLSFLVEGLLLRAILGAMGLASVMIVLRSAEVLNAMSVMLYAVGGTLVLWIAGAGGVLGARFWDLVRLARATALTFVTGAARLAGLSVSEESAEGTGQSRSERFLPLIAGLVIALPVLLVVMQLLTEADPIFERGVDFIGDLIAGDLFEHTIRSVFLAWIMGGWYAGTLQPRQSFAEANNGLRFPLSVHLPTLVGFCVILAVFLGVQARTLFGGSEFVMETAGLTLAEYARGGFFQLVVVAFLATGLLVVVDGTSQRSDEKSERHFRVLGTTLVGLVILLALSAAYRLSLYVGSFGLSEDRVLAFAAMIGIVGAIVWFAATVLRGKGEWLASGLAVGGFVWVVALNLLNPDALVSRVNLARAAAGAEFDLKYHLERSADAVPALLNGARQLPPEQCEALVTGLRASFRGAVRDNNGNALGWRAWDLPSTRARVLVAMEEGALVAQRCTP